jgi:hypothetical protein
MFTFLDVGEGDGKIELYTGLTVEQVKELLKRL